MEIGVTISTSPSSKDKKANSMSGDKLWEDQEARLCSERAR